MCPRDNDPTRLQSINDRWKFRTRDLPEGEKLPSKVRWGGPPAVRPLLCWAFAHRAARKGPWEDFARDRQRFRRRCEELHDELLAHKVFHPVTRQRVYSLRIRPALAREAAREEKEAKEAEEAEEEKQRESTSKGAEEDRRHEVAENEETWWGDANVYKEDALDTSKNRENKEEEEEEEEEKEEEEEEDDEEEEEEEEEEGEEESEDEEKKEKEGGEMKEDDEETEEEEDTESEEETEGEEVTEEEEERVEDRRDNLRKIEKKENENEKEEDDEEEEEDDDEEGYEEEDDDEEGDEEEDEKEEDKKVEEVKDEDEEQDREIKEEGENGQNKKEDKNKGNNEEKNTVENEDEDDSEEEDDELEEYSSDDEENTKENNISNDILITNKTSDRQKEYSTSKREFNNNNLNVNKGTIKEVNDPKEFGLDSKLSVTENIAEKLTKELFPTNQNKEMRVSPEQNLYINKPERRQYKYEDINAEQSPRSITEKSNMASLALPGETSSELKINSFPGEQVHVLNLISKTEELTSQTYFCHVL